MTENKAIEWLRAISATQNQSSHSASLSDRKEALYMAIQALEEIQEFRKQGITIEKVLDMMCDLAGAENLIEQYRAIGTVEEFKALKDKSEPKKIKYEEYCGFSDPVCPECKRDIDSEDKYCRWCGQTLKS